MRAAALLITALALCACDSGDLAASAVPATATAASSGTGASGGGGAGGGQAGAGGAAGGAAAWTWELPPGFPVPLVPADNPMSKDKVELGRHLFYDQRLSENETQACASCHVQSLAFTDGKASSLGSTGSATPRSAMSLGNVAYGSVFTWANPLLLELETQAAVPLLGTEPVELGFGGKEAELEARLAADPYYSDLFPIAFPEDSTPIRVENVVRAIAAFERTLFSGRSAYDRYTFDGDEGALSDAAKRGLELFSTSPFQCFHCHAGFDFQDSVKFEGGQVVEVEFHNTGLYNIGGTGAYPEPNTGLYASTGVASDMGKFRAPTLRNVTVTGPYMHDGSIATLSEVLDHYAAGGRNILTGPNAGDGAHNPYKSDLVAGFELSDGDRADLLAFLESLTDDELMTNPAFAAP